MAIQSGIGVGEAQVYNTNGSLNTYARLMQQQQLTRQREQKELTDQLSKVKVDGIREADRNMFYEKYEKAKDTFRQTLNTKDKREKMYLQGEMDRQLLELNDFGSRSREYGKLHQEVSGKFLDDRFRDQFEDSAVKKWQESDKYSIDDERLVKDPSTLVRQLDGSKILDLYNKIDDQVLQTTGKYDNDYNGTVNKDGTSYKRVKRGSTEAQLEGYVQLFKTNPTVRAFARKEYADVFNSMPEDEAIVKVMQDISSKRPLVREETPHFVAKDKFYAHEDYKDIKQRARHRDGIGDSQEGTPSAPTPVDIPFGGGKGVVRVNDYRGVSLPKKNFVGSEYIDMDTGKSGGKLESSSDYEVVGFGNFPILNSPNARYNGELAQPDAEAKFSKEGKVIYKPMVHVQIKKKVGSRDVTKNFLVPYDKAPLNVMQSKSVKQALSGFQPAKINTSTSTTKTNNSVSSGKQSAEERLKKLREKYKD